MLKKIVLTGLIVCSTIVVLAQNKEEKKLIIEQVKIQDQKLSEFMESSLIDSVVSLFSPNCHYAPEFGGIYESREKVNEALKKDFKNGKKIKYYKLEPIEYKVYGDLILEVGVNKIEYGLPTDKALYVEEYNYMFVWKKSKKDNFRIRSAMWNSPTNPCK